MVVLPFHVRGVRAPHRPPSRPHLLHAVWWRLTNCHGSACTVRPFVLQGPALEDSKTVFEGLDGLSLHIALNEPAMLKRLLLRGEKPDTRDRDGDRTPLHWCAASPHWSARARGGSRRHEPVHAGTSRYTPAHAMGTGRLRAFRCIAVYRGAQAACRCGPATLCHAVT